MRTRLLLMQLYRLEKRLPLSCDFPVFHRYHLVEVNCVVLPSFLERLLLVREPAAPAAEGLHVVPCAQLIVEGLQLILNLRVVLARTWALLLIFWNVV